MPYILKDTRKYFDEHPHEAKTPWDITYVLYKHVFLPIWAQAPRWRTYFHLKKVLHDPRLEPKLMGMVKGLMANGAEGSDIATAAAIAVDEIKRRYCDAYEDSQILAEGDIPLPEVK